MAVEIVDCIQGSVEWHDARRGIPTASNFGDIIAQSDEKKIRKRYLRDLAGEILSGITAERFESAAMIRGRAMEAAALEHYERETFDEVYRVGIGKNAGLLKLKSAPPIGASPDALVGTKGGVECKSMAPHLMIDVLDRGAAGFPSEHRAQVQGNMWVFEREWWDLKIFWPGMPRCQFRVERDDAYIAEMARAIEIFCFDLRKLVEKLQAMKGRG